MIPKFVKYSLFILNVLKYAVFAFVLYIAFLQITNLYTAIVESEFDILSNVDGWLILIACLLMPINWALEALKWSTLTYSIDTKTNRSVLREVLSGIALSILTPNRIGEYIGRLAHFAPKYHVSILGLNVLGSFSQFSVTLMGGLLGLSFIGELVWVNIELDYPYIYIIVSLVILCLMTGLAIIYANYLIRLVAFIVPRSWGSLLIERLDALIRLNMKLRLWILFISLIRYAVYVSQFVFLLYGFGLDISIVNAMSGVGLVYMIQSGVPLPTILSLVFRGSVAIFVFEILGSSGLESLLASYTLWIINLGLPALVGGGILFKVNLRKTIGYEAE